MLTKGFELNPAFAFTLLGSCAIYFWTRPRRFYIFTVFILALALRTIYLAIGGVIGAYFWASWISWGSFLGIASLIGLVLEVIFGSAARKPFLVRTFYGAVVFPLLGLVAGYSIPLNVWLHPKTYDPFLLAFDGTLGFQPSFFLGELLRRNFWAWGLTTVIYYALPLSGIILYASYRVRKQQPVAVLYLLLSTMIAGFLLYSVYPAVGPNHAYPNLYPSHPPHLSDIVIATLTVANDPRNCVPSLHLATALLVFWNSQIWPRWGRFAAAIFLVWTVFSTLALGEHYLVDLIVALPFSLFLQSVWTIGISWHERRIPVLMGSFTTFIWYLLLRFGIQIFIKVSGLSWVLIIVTIYITFFFAGRLRKTVAEKVLRKNDRNAILV